MKAWFTYFAFRLMGFLIAVLTMFATLPALADSAPAKSKEQTQATSKTDGKTTHVAASGSAVQDDRPIRYHMDDFYDDLKLPPRQQN